MMSALNSGRLWPSYARTIRWWDDLRRKNQPNGECGQRDEGAPCHATPRSRLFLARSITSAYKRFHSTDDDRHIK